MAQPQTESALVWFQLVDSTGSPFKGITSVDAVSLSTNSLLVQFRDAVKAKFDQPEYLRDLPSALLVVYKNKDAFSKRDAKEKQLPLKSSQSLDKLGTTDVDPLIVVVPVSEQVSAASRSMDKNMQLRECFQVLEENKGLKEYLEKFDEEKYFNTHPFLHAHRLGKNLQSKAADELCELFGSRNTVVLVGVSGCGKSHAI
jgi:hypothetical protein